MKQSVELVTNASPENLVERILTYAARPLSEFNKYEVLEMLETLHNKAADGNHDRKKYYRLVYQTVNVTHNRKDTVYVGERLRR